MPDPPPEPIYTFRGSMKQIHSILPIIKDINEFIYVGTNSGYVHVWDLKLKREKIKHQLGSEPCFCILYHDCYFITQLRGDSIKFWSENSDGVWKLQKVIKHDYSGFCKMDILNDNIYLPSYNSDMIVYDFKNNKEKILKGEKDIGEVMCLKVIVNLRCILVGYESGVIILWSNEWLILDKRKITHNSTDCPMAIDFCELTSEGILATNNNTIFKFALKENKIFATMEVELTNPGVSSVAINKEGKLCVLGCWDNRIRYLSMKKLTLLAVLNHHSDSINSVVFINKFLSFCDYGVVVAGGKDSRVSLWNLYTKAHK